METFPSSAIAYWAMARSWWEYLWDVVNSGHSGGLGALSLADGTAAAIIHPGVIPGQEQRRGCWVLARLSPPIACAPLLSSHVGSPWDAEAVGACGVSDTGPETWSSALLAFSGIVFPTPTENAKSKEFLHKIVSLLNPICLPLPHVTAPAAAREIQGRVIKHCGP